MARKAFYKNDDIKKPKTEEQSVGLWHERISIAKKEQDSWVQEFGAKRFTEAYKGNFELSMAHHGMSPKIRILPINEVFAYVQSDLSSTYSRDPYIAVNAKAGTTLGAKLWEVWLNYEWRELKSKEEIELEIIDKDLGGYAMHKVGHTVDSIGTGEQLKILREELYSMRVDWRDVFWNIGARRPPYDCQWMAQRIVRPLDDIKSKYPNAKNLKGACHPDIDEDYYKRTQYKDDIEVGIYYEIWDARDRKIYLIAEGLKDKFLDEPREWPSYLDEFPFLMYWDFAIPGQARPMSAIAPWEPQILASIFIMSSAVNHTKRWNRQMVINNGQMDDVTLDKFEQGLDGSVLVNNGLGDLDKNIKLLDFGQLPTDFYMVLDRLNAIKRDVNGQPEFDRGGVTKTNTRTIGELQLIKAGAKSRTDRRIDRLETHLENIARHMMAHLKANFDFEKAVKVTGEVPEEVIKALGNHYNTTTGMVTFTDDEIQGEYDVEIKAGSTLPLDEETQNEVLGIVLENVAQVSGRGPVPPLMNAVIQELLSNYKIKSLEEAYKLEQTQAIESQATQEGQQSIEDQKTQAEAGKREAQAQQIQVETRIMAEQEADRQLNGGVMPGEEKAQ